MAKMLDDSEGKMRFVTIAVANRLIIFMCGLSMGSDPIDNFGKLEIGCVFSIIMIKLC